MRPSPLGRDFLPFGFVLAQSTGGFQTCTFAKASPKPNLGLAVEPRLGIKIPGSEWLQYFLTAPDRKILRQKNEFVETPQIRNLAVELLCLPVKAGLGQSSCTAVGTWAMPVWLAATQLLSMMLSK
jgi:hypothetical protein